MRNLIYLMTASSFDAEKPTVISESQTEKGQRNQSENLKSILETLNNKGKDSNNSKKELRNFYFLFV